MKLKKCKSPQKLKINKKILERHGYPSDTKYLPRWTPSIMLLRVAVEDISEKLNAVIEHINEKERLSISGVAPRELIE